MQFEGTLWGTNQLMKFNLTTSNAYPRLQKCKKGAATVIIRDEKRKKEELQEIKK